MKKYIITLLVCILGTTACQTQVIYQEKDKAIFNDLLNKLGNQQELSIADLVVKVGECFLDTPYVGHTLETEPEQLIINLRELDCTTFGENCLALARTLKSSHPTFDKYTAELRNIRYRDGIMDGYPSRLHYFSDWIDNNAKKGLIKSVAEQIAHIPFVRTVNFMTSHTVSYRQLKDNPAFVESIRKQEEIITDRNKFYIPKGQLSNYENQLKNGDIIGITTNIEGMDILHVGVVVIQAGKPHFMHASSSAGKVVITDKTLYKYLMDWSKATGIMVARPL